MRLKKEMGFSPISLGLLLYEVNLALAHLRELALFHADKAVLHKPAGNRACLVVRDFKSFAQLRFGQAVTAVRAQRLNDCGAERRVLLLRLLCGLRLALVVAAVETGQGFHAIGVQLVGQVILLHHGGEELACGHLLVVHGISFLNGAKVAALISEGLYLPFTIIIIAQFCGKSTIIFQEFRLS